MNEITIELKKREFAGGDTVEGEVLVRLEKDTRLRGIRLMLKGYEKASWSEGSGKHRHSHSETRTFFNEEVALEGSPRLSPGQLVADSLIGVFSKDRYELLRADTYCYPFTYDLPPDLPGDYQSSLTRSQIYYGVKAQVDLPLKFDLKAEQLLMMNEPANTIAAQEVTQRKAKKFLFDPDALIDATVHLEKDTFCLGEVLHCQLEVTNRASKKEIRAATLVLRQVERLCAEGRTHERQTEVTRARFEECRFPFKECSTAGLELEIPGGLYPTIARGSLVKLDYELQVVLDIPWAVDAKLSVPVKFVRAAKPS